ncbi:MAG: TIGR02221 family CRISPR-associated protein [Caldilineaceae bacterium SB0661_bin_32]|uniref:TIGR02221 family CRISPR-associated protein n=1 Tax=Caldilineaceae bacterium SB0661_bin_32 TaxID=2605255 RepID=A0A6B1D8A9_9CHLR|nr:TIGR02221 family CRISPR-associated protein [Caldilineaceae bacterium SB0661_bin_32]
MKALTFLGAAKAHETIYIMPNGREYAAPYFGVALARFFPDADMKVFVTDKAREMHWDSFQRLAEDYVDNLEAVEIPDGADESELWSLFQTVVDAVNEREEVIFDITHGFRPLPFLSLLAVAYLRQVKQIDLRAVLYGNFEARDQSVAPHRTPVVDLSGFVSLFDWMTSADRFTRFGDAGDLAEQLRKVKPSWQDQRADPAKREEAKRLSFAARSLDDVSMALRLIRPAEAMDASSELNRRLADASQSIQVNARPFVSLVRSITDAYAPLAMPSSQQKVDLVGQLANERRMVDWLLDRKQYVQAVAIAREWIISWVMAQVEMDDILNKLKRREVEEILGKALHERQGKHGSFNDVRFPNGNTLRSIGQISQALDIYAKLVNARNDLLHAGKRRNPGKAKEMEKNVKNLCPRLAELRLPPA